MALLKYSSILNEDENIIKLQIENFTVTIEKYMIYSHIPERKLISVWDIVIVRWVLYKYVVKDDPPIPDHNIMERVERESSLGSVCATIFVIIIVVIMIMRNCVL